MKWVNIIMLMNLLLKRTVFSAKSGVMLCRAVTGGGVARYIGHLFRFY